VPISGVNLYLVLWRAARAAQAYDHASIEDLGLNVTDFAVLECLLHKGPLSISAIGARVLLTSGSMTAAVDRLERQGLVERRADPGDRRSRIVHLTTDGRALIECAFDKHEEAVNELFAELGATDRRRLYKALREVGRRAESLRAAEP
jgi:MarR family 2-MHQ and catechol resistance regulon transcriptional repressor